VQLLLPLEQLQELLLELQLQVPLTQAELLQTQELEQPQMQELIPLPLLPEA
jgi:hypothetical protein